MDNGRKMRKKGKDRAEKWEKDEEKWKILNEKI